MKKNSTVIIASAALLSALFLIFLGNKAPFIPSNEPHRKAATNSSCGECHDPGTQSPLKTGHPPKEQCLVCHTR